MASLVLGETAVHFLSLSAFVCFSFLRKDEVSVIINIDIAIVCINTVCCITGCCFFKFHLRDLFRWTVSVMLRETVIARFSTMYSRRPSKEQSVQRVGGGWRILGARSDRMSSELRYLACVPSHCAKISHCHCLQACLYGVRECKVCALLTAKTEWANHAQLKGEQLRYCPFSSLVC